MFTPNVQKILNAYLECAAWSTTDDDGYPLDDWKLEFSEIAKRRALDDIRSFLVDCTKYRVMWHEKWSEEQLGHDFWLTRNWHGSGFWDRESGALGERLTHIAHSFGEVHVYVSENEELAFARYI